MCNDELKFCPECDGRGAIESGIAECGARQCRHCDGTGTRPPLVVRLERRVLKEHGGGHEELRFHWNLSRDDSLLHRETAFLLRFLSAWLDDEEFYNAMQGYRCAPVTDQREVVAHFENVKRKIRERLDLEAAAPSNVELTFARAQAVPKP